MEVNQNFEEVPVFTGEAEVLPDNNVPQAIPQVPMLRSQTQYHTAVSVQKPRKLDKGSDEDAEIFDKILDFIFDLFSANAQK